MKHAFFSTARPQVFAHRGGAGLAPENTLAAFDHGLALGADGLELDVCLSHDGVVVIHHDPLLDRTTDLRGAVGERTAAELAGADAGWHFRPEEGYPFRGRGLGVPTLAAVLERYRDAQIIVELKEEREELARAAVAVVRSAGAIERICFGSHGLRGLRAVRALEPAVATSAAAREVRWAVLRSWCGWRPTWMPYAGFQVPERAGCIRVVSARFIAYARRSGLAVHVWTVDRVADAARLLQLGVDALITDRPDLLVPLVRESARDPDLCKGDRTSTPSSIPES